MKRIFVKGIFEYIQLLKYLESCNYLWMNGTAIFDCSDDIDFPLEIRVYPREGRVLKDQRPVPELSYTVDEFLKSVGAHKRFDAEYGVGDLVIYKCEGKLYVGIIKTISSGLNSKNFYNIAANSTGLYYGVEQDYIIAKLDDSYKMACHMAVGI